MNEYRVFWETKIGLGLGFYSGFETITGVESEDEAVAIVQRRVYRRDFQDYGKKSIKISRIEKL